MASAFGFEFYGKDSSQFYAGFIRELRRFEMRENFSKEISAAAKPVREDMQRAVKGLRSEARFEGYSKNSRSTRRRGGSGASARSEYATRKNTVNMATAVETGQTLITRKTWNKKRLEARSLRDSVAKGVRLVNRYQGKDAGIIIRTSATYLPLDQKTLPRAMNRGQWRHPFFGNREFWVEQTTRPKGWFTQTAKKSRPQFEKAVTKAIDDAVMELAVKHGVK